MGLNLQRRPSFDAEWVRDLLRSNYGIDVVDMRPLAGERDTNIVVSTRDSQRYVLKAWNLDDSFERIEAECLVLGRLQHLPFIPQIALDVRGNVFAKQQVRSRSVFVRVVTFVSGRPFAECANLPHDILADLGRKLGMIDLALWDFVHSAIERPFDWNLMDACRVIDSYHGEIADRSLQALVVKIAEESADLFSERAKLLRCSAIHNDANDHNVIVDTTSGRPIVNGIIDFGDVARSFTVAEVAIAITYSAFHYSDWLEAGCRLLRGYHQVVSLNEHEILALGDLIKLRLATSLCMSSHQQSLRPNDPYLSVSQPHVERLLRAISAIPRSQIETAFSVACSETGR